MKIIKKTDTDHLKFKDLEVGDLFYLPSVSARMLRTSGAPSASSDRGEEIIYLRIQDREMGAQTLNAVSLTDSRVCYFNDDQCNVIKVKGELIIYDKSI